MVLYFRIFLFFQYWKMILRQSGVALHPTIIVKKLMGKDHLTKILLQRLPKTQIYLFIEAPR